MTMPITREYIAQKQAERAALEEQALADGQLWTVQIAFHVGHAVALIVWGRNEPDPEGEAFQEAHTGAVMFLDPTVILGDKLHVRQQVCKMANVDDMRIVVRGAPKRQPITPGIYQL